MNFGAAETVARALLYEGYLLYPYRPSSLKNQQRWTFGSLYPPAFVEAARAEDKHRMQTECVVVGEEARISVSVRFLQLVPSTRPARGPASDAPREAMERRVDVEGLSVHDLLQRSHRAEWALSDGVTTVLRASVTASAIELAPAVFRLRIVIQNETPIAEAERLSRAAAELHALCSTHTLLGAKNGRFVSLLEPPRELESATSTCSNVGTWPVLIGDAPRDDTMLSSPIILYDRPQIAPESPGDFFDGTEIDEMLALRVRTLAEHERREILATDPRGAAILQRVEQLESDALASLHGSWRSVSASASARSTGPQFRAGDRVVVRPRPNGDVLDLALAGEAATVASVEVDFEGRVYCAVTVDSDPGRDLGTRGMPGHRFFFTPDELERVE